MILSNRYENSPFAQFYTNSFAFIRESYACISECFAQYNFFSTKMSSMAFRRNVFWNCTKKISDVILNGSPLHWGFHESQFEFQYHFFILCSDSFTQKLLNYHWNTCEISLRSPHQFPTRGSLRRVLRPSIDNSSATEMKKRERER